MFSKDLSGANGEEVKSQDDRPFGAMETQTKTYGISLSQKPAEEEKTPINKKLHRMCKINHL